MVISIIGVLATIGLPLAELAQRRTQEEELRQALRDIRSALDNYKQKVDQGHIIRAVGDTGYPPDLNVLEAGVVDAQSPRGAKLYFLRRLPRDPFAPSGLGTAAETWGLRSAVSSASEPQPGRDVYDVYSKSTQIGFNGTPYRQW